MSYQESLVTKIKDCLSRGEDLAIPLLDVKSREVIEYPIRDLVLMYNSRGVFSVAPKHKNTRIYEIKFTSEDDFIGEVDYYEGQIFARDPVKNYNRDYAVDNKKRQLTELVWTGTDLVELTY